MSTAEKIYELMKKMPEEQVGEVLNFVESLQHKSQQAVNDPPLTVPVQRGLARKPNIDQLT